MFLACFQPSNKSVSRNISFLFEIILMPSLAYHLVCSLSNKFFFLVYNLSLFPNRVNSHKNEKFVILLLFRRMFTLLFPLTSLFIILIRRKWLLTFTWIINGKFGSSVYFITSCHYFNLLIFILIFSNLTLIIYINNWVCSLAFSLPLNIAVLKLAWCIVKLLWYRLLEFCWYCENTMCRSANDYLDLCYLDLDTALYISII